MMGITLKVSFKKKKLQKSLLSSKNTTLTIGKVWYEEKIVPIRSYISCTANELHAFDIFNLNFGRGVLVLARAGKSSPGN